MLTIFFATSFTTALQRVYLRAWRRPPRRRRRRVLAGGGLAAGGTGLSWRSSGGLRGALGGGLGFGLFAIVSLAVTSGLWWFTAWFLLQGEVRARVLVPTGVITGIATAGYAASATIWMPGVVTSNEAQFGFFGVALSLVTWFSGAAICILIGACAGPVFAEDTGRVGRLVRGGESGTLTAGARPSLPPPARELSLRDAFRSTEGS